MEDGSDKWPKILNLKDSLDIIRSKLNADTPATGTSKPCTYKCCTVQSCDLKEQLIGLIQIDPQSGQYQLKDNSNSVDLIFIDGTRPKVNLVTKLTNFMACKEVMTVGRALKWTFFYIFVNDFIQLPGSSIQEADSLTTDLQENMMTVKLVSHPMKSNGNMSVIIAANKDQAENQFVRVPVKSHVHYPLGAQISLIESSREKRFNHNLHKFLKSGLMQQQELQASVIDVMDVKVVSNALWNYDADATYDISDVEKLPQGEMLDIKGIIKEKWLELRREPLGKRDQDPALLSHVNLELKLTSGSLA